MKKIIFSTMIASLLAFVGCQNEELVSENTNNGGEKVILTANIQGAADSRVVLTYDENDEVYPVKVEWNESGETFEVYGSSGASSTFTQIAGTNQFEGTLPESANGEYEVFYGNYDSLDEQDGKLGQSTANDTPVLMGATFDSSSPSITFEHLTAILKPTFMVDDTDIDNSITKIVMGDVAKPTPGSSGNAFNLETITITPTSSANVLDDNIYIHLFVSQLYVENYEFTFTVTAGDTEYIGSLTIPEDMSIEAGNLYTAEIALTEVIPYVTFSAVSEQTLDLTQKITEEYDDYTDEYVYVRKPYPGSGDDTGYIEYSVGNSNVWERFTPESQSVEFGGDYGDLRLRGISPNGTLYAQIVFGNATPVACSGDIRTLVDYTNYETTSTANACFIGLFENCSALADASKLKLISNNNEMAESCYNSMFAGCTNLDAAPELPATDLAPYCYKSMFYGCTGLINAPELPATSLAASCYGQMFHGCTKLDAAPELPATILANDCYNGMFASCTRLTSAPELPAENLVTGCYSGMFNSCTSLTLAPELPATTLEDYCYTCMFMNCTSLTSAPALPATTLKTSCYYEMFKRCTKLKSVTMLATNIKVTNCLANWLEDVAATGTFTKAADLEHGDGEGKIPTGASGIPSSWNVVNYEAQ